MRKPAHQTVPAASNSIINFCHGVAPARSSYKPKRRTNVPGPIKTAKVRHSERNRARTSFGKSSNTPQAGDTQLPPIVRLTVGLEPSPQAPHGWSYQQTKKSGNEEQSEIASHALLVVDVARLFD